MGIYLGNKEITSIHKDGKSAQEVWNYVNGAWRLVWQAIRSCFGSGKWVGNKPWIGKEKWKGTK